LVSARGVGVRGEDPQDQRAIPCQERLPRRPVVPVDAISKEVQRIGGKLIGCRGLHTRSPTQNLGIAVHNGGTALSPTRSEGKVALSLFPRGVGGTSAVSSGFDDGGSGGRT